MMEPGNDALVSEARPLPQAMPAGQATAPKMDPPKYYKPPQLLWPLEPRSTVFFRNLADLLLLRGLPHVEITAHPAEFWGDVFVNQRLSKRALMDSALLHVFLLVVIVGVTQTYITYRPPELHDAFQHTRLTFYEVSEYLPEVHSAPDVSKPRPVRHGLPPAPADPVYARQEIISVPPEPDNLRQTIVTPSSVRIDRDVPLPNIVTAQPPRAAEVLQVANGARPKLETPPEIVAPKLKIAMAPPELANASTPQAAQVMNISNASAPKSLTPPEVDAPRLAIGMKLPAVATGAAPKAAPAPIQVTNGRRQRAAAPGEVAAPAVKGSVPAPTLATTTSVLPQPAPAPTVSAANNEGAGKTPDAKQQILALSVAPAPANGPLNIPEGSRHGVFAAGPTGRADASGAPESSPDSANASPSAGNGMPSGIHVSGGGDAAPHAGVVASGAPAPREPAGADSLRNRMAAMVASPTIPPPRVGADDQTKSDTDPQARAVFGDKRYYKLTVNMPNLTSASGSWVIRFAELHPLADQAKIPLSSPIPTRKSDPAYPPDLMKDKVEGTVVLYAVIRADGTITDVKVLNSINERLDQSAVAALHRWQFQPGSKDGKAVDVEAVVQVPFRVKKLLF